MKTALFNWFKKGVKHLRKITSLIYFFQNLHFLCFFPLVKTQLSLSQNNLFSYRIPFDSCLAMKNLNLKKMTHPCVQYATAYMLTQYLSKGLTTLL